MLNSLVGYLRRNVIALAALVLALSGTAYAASQINSSDIKDNSVKGADVRDDSLTGRDIKDGSVKAGDLSARAIPTTTVGATVLNEGGNYQVINPLGFTAVQRTGVGTYALTIDPTSGAGADCNFAASPEIGIGTSKPIAIFSTEASNETIVFQVNDVDGNPADIGTPATGYAAFSIVGSCPS